MNRSWLSCPTSCGPCGNRPCSLGRRQQIWAPWSQPQALMQRARKRASSWRGLPGMSCLNPVARMGYAPNRLVPLRRSSAETKNRCGKMILFRCRLRVNQPRSVYTPKADELDRRALLPLLIQSGHRLSASRQGKTHDIPSPALYPKESLAGQVRYGRLCPPHMLSRRPW